MPLISDTESQPLLRTLLDQNPHRWVFVLVHDELVDVDGTITARVTDLRDGVLGYLPIGKLAGWARAFVEAGTIICPAQLRIGVDGASTHVAVDGDFIRRQLDDTAATRARPTA